MRIVFASLALAACAAPAASAGLPDRAAVGEAIRQALDCDVSDAASCGEQPRRTNVHSLRCRPDATAENPGRVLCRFSGTHVRRSGARHFGPECAWLTREPEGNWRIDIWPEADVCDT